jgi:uncharacterized protein
LPGTGKSYVAERLAAKFDAVHLQSDSIRKQLAGVPLTANRSDAPDNGLYTRALGIRTYREMLRRARVFLKAGHTVIVDATFLYADSRERARSLAARLKVPVLFVHAHCPEKTVVSRMRRRARTRTFTDADLSIYRRMKARFTAPKVGKDLIRVDTRQPVNRSVARIERALLRL